MKLFGSDTNFGMIRKISDWFGMNFNPKLSPGFFCCPNKVLYSSPTNNSFDDATKTFVGTIKILLAQQKVFRFYINHQVW